MSYLKVKTLAEAQAQLNNLAPQVQVIAGGTDLFLKELPEHLIDISALAELKEINEKDGLLEVGAAVTHSMAATSSLLLAKATALSEACLHVGSPQIRNVGTLGGNVINAAPAADAAVALAALGAETLLADRFGNMRSTALDQLYSGFNCSAVDCSSNILVKFAFPPCSTGEGSAFTRFAARRALALPMANAAVRIKIDDGIITRISLVAAPVKPAPTRFEQTEAILTGQPATEETWLKAEKYASEEAEVRGSLLRCSADYRRHLIGVLVTRALRIAAERALAGKDVL
jgi:CO/xanthine dehydrogenase FAD-binding subunit